MALSDEEDWRRRFAAGEAAGHMPRRAADWRVRNHSSDGRPGLHRAALNHGGWRVAEMILHMGLHKTATGALQRQFFPACGDCRLLTAARPGVRRLVDLVTRKDPLYFDPGEARRVIDPELDPDRPNLLSNESFSGPPYAGVIEAGLDHRGPVLENLRACFPEARVVLVLRRQDDLARSLYRQYLKAGGTRDVRRFYGLRQEVGRPLMSLDRFRFSRYIEAVKRSFPAGVLVLAYEQFVADQAAFLHRLTRFIGVDDPGVVLRSENATRLGPAGMEVSRLLNHLFRSNLNQGGALPSPRQRLPGGGYRRMRPVALLHDKWPGRVSRGHGALFEVGREILEMVREDNVRLDRAHDLGLSAYGYY